VLPSTPTSLAADTIVNEVVSTLIKYLDASIDNLSSESCRVLSLFPTK